MSKLGKELWGKIEQYQGWAFISDDVEDYDDEAVLRIAMAALYWERKAVKVLEKFLNKHDEDTDALGSGKPDFVVGQLVRSKEKPTFTGHVREVYQDDDGTWMVRLGTSYKTYHPAESLRHLNAEEVGPHWHTE